MSCATQKVVVKKRPSDFVSLPVGLSAEDAPRYEAALKELMERNTTVEDDPAWIEDSYKTFTIKNLLQIPSRSYDKYARYLDGGAVYIIVHPAYTTFFMLSRKRTEGAAKDDAAYAKNTVEKLLDTPADNPKMALIQAQERQMRDFLELKSTEKKLIIIIFEKGYLKNKNYAYKDGPDELKRFINEVTNESNSVFYIESKPDGGSLKEEDRVTLQEFLLSIKAERILLGGSYLGRCVEGFYNSFTNDYGDIGVFLVPELTAVSPRDIPDRAALMLLLPDGTLNVEAAAKFIHENAYGNMDKVPAISLLNATGGH